MPFELSTCILLLGTLLVTPIAAIGGELRICTEPDRAASKVTCLVPCSKLASPV